MRKGRRETSSGNGESERATTVGIEKAVAGSESSDKAGEARSVEKALARINRKRFTCGSFGTPC